MVGVAHEANGVVYVLDGGQDALHTGARLFGLLGTGIDMGVAGFNQGFDFTGSLGAA